MVVRFLENLCKTYLTDEIKRQNQKLPLENLGILDLRSAGSTLDFAESFNYTLKSPLPSGDSRLIT